MDNFSDMYKDAQGVRPCEWTMESYSSMDKAERLDWKVALQQDIEATAERWLRQAERN